MKPLLHKYVNIHSMNPRRPTASLGLPLSELFWSSEEREREEKNQEKSIQRQKILLLASPFFLQDIILVIEFGHYLVTK